MLLAVKRLTPWQQLQEEISRQTGWTWAIVAAVVMLALIALVLKLKDWLRPNGLLEDSPEQLLMSFREIHREGDLSADEYQMIRERLTKKSGEASRKDDSASGPSAKDSAGTSPLNEL